MLSTLVVYSTCCLPHSRFLFFCRILSDQTFRWFLKVLCPPSSLSFSLFKPITLLLIKFYINVEIFTMMLETWILTFHFCVIFRSPYPSSSGKCWQTRPRTRSITAQEKFNFSLIIFLILLTICVCLYCYVW